MANRPKLGQHFLHDEATLERIATAATRPRDTVVEIGPGRGALTSHLLARARRVVAIELDGELADSLMRRCGRPDNLRVVHGDILKCQLSDYVSPSEAARNAITGNLPYYIASPILRTTLASGHIFRAATFLLQEEVADRAVAEAGSRSYGFLSCLCQLYSEPRKVLSVPPGAFTPPPKVRSALVRFRLRNQRPAEGLETFLGACFRSPRKTLRNNLARIYPRDRVSRDPCASLRAQQLKTGELVAMWKRLEA